MATDHGREDRRLVNQLRVVRPGRKVNVALRRHLEVEALSDELSPALRQKVDVSVRTELFRVIRCRKLRAKHLFIDWAETFCFHDVLFAQNGIDALSLLVIIRIKLICLKVHVPVSLVRGLPVILFCRY